MDANEGLGLVDFVEQNTTPDELDSFYRGVAVRAVARGFATPLPEQAEATVTPEAPVGAETLLSPEQKAHADLVVATMSESLGLGRENIRLVVTDSPEHGKQVVAVDASPNGRYVGSYNGIPGRREAKPDCFMLDIAGQKVDALAGTTDAAYRAMIADAKARGVKLLPDSYALSQENGEPWTWTMLTGEELTADGDVQFRRVDGGGVYGGIAGPGSDDRGLRVRPAAVVAQLES